MAEAFVCRKHYMLNHDEVGYELDPNLKEELRCHSHGIQAGGKTKANVFRCPKEAKDEKTTCMVCQFSIPVSGTGIHFQV